MLNRRRFLTGGLLFLLLLRVDFARGAELTDRGEYVFRISGCASCHTSAEEGAAPLAGGRKLATAFGVFFGPNITPHPKHGIGGWDVKDLSRALRRGESPGNIHLYPAFPYPSYAGMSDEDIEALMEYLKRVPESSRPNQPHILPWYLRSRKIIYLWKLLFLDSDSPALPPGGNEALNRGAYLVNTIGHCGECHTPRNRFGVLDQSRQLSGNPQGPDGDAVPNITPHPEDGIGNWSERELREYLRFGLMPDGDVAGGAMADVIDSGLRYLTDEDVGAIIAYLKSIHPMESTGK